MSEDITKELCIGCGEYKPRGLFPTINHSCALNTFTYRVGKFGMRQLSFISYPAFLKRYMESRSPKHLNSNLPFSSSIKFPLSM